MIELLIVAYMNYKLFRIKVYNHQKCAIIYNTCFCTLLKIIVVIISYLCDGFDQNNLYKQDVYLIPVGIIIYIIILILRAYSITKIKYYMDLKYISSTKIVLYSSLIGVFLFLSICVIETFIECSFLKDINICAVSDENKSYIDTFLIYLKNEIISTFFGIISYFLYLYFYSLILKYLTPVHYAFSNSIYVFLIQPIFLFYHKFKTGQYFNGPKEFKLLKYHQFQLNLVANFDCSYWILSIFRIY